jgi:hypothetical protein
MGMETFAVGAVVKPGAASRMGPLLSVTGSVLDMMVLWLFVLMRKKTLNCIISVPSLAVSKNPARFFLAQ